MNKIKPVKKYEHIIIIIALAAVNFLLKGFFLSDNSLAGDEPFSVYHAQMSISSIIKILSEGNNPPLYEVLLHFWIKIFGISEFSVRFPSLIFSCITVGLIYKIGIKYLNPRIALYSSMIFLFSNYHILFAHESRVYSFLGMLTVISAYIFMAILHDFESNSEAAVKGKKLTIKFLLLAIVNTFIIYAHYFGFFVLIVQFLFLVFNPVYLFRYWKKVLLSAGITSLLYLPNALVVLNRFFESSGGTWVRRPDGVESIYNMLWSFSNAPVVTVLVIAIFVFSILKYLVSYKKTPKNIYHRYIVFWFVFIFLFMFGVSYWIPMFLDRYLMPAAIAFIFVLAIAADYVIQKRRYNYIVPVLVILLFIITCKPNITNHRKVQEVVKKIESIKTKNSILIFCPAWFDINFLYYYNIEYFKDVSEADVKDKVNSYLNSENIFPINNYDQLDEDLIKRADKIIYLDAGADFSFPNNNIKKELDLNYFLKNEDKAYDVFKIFEYELK